MLAYKFNEEGEIDVAFDKVNKKFIFLTDPQEQIKNEIIYSLHTNKRNNNAITNITDKKANSGYIGELFISDTRPKGSLLWLLSNQTQDVEDKNFTDATKSYINDSLQYLITNGIVNNIYTEIYTLDNEIKIDLDVSYKDGSFKFSFKF